MEKTLYEVTMQHTEDTLVKLAHMQYDLFCKSNRVARTILSVALILLGVVNSEAWWGILVIAYGCYLMTSTYSAANHTAHKLAAQLKKAGLEMPASRYVFRRKAMDVITLPEETALGEPLAYVDIESLGEDAAYFYIFRDEYGGYMIPKSELGEKAEGFRALLEQETGKSFVLTAIPVVRFYRWLKDRESRPKSRMLKKRR